MKLNGISLSPVSVTKSSKHSGQASSRPTISQSPIRFGLNEMDVAFLQATGMGKAQYVREFILMELVDVNMIDDDGWTPLIYAASTDHEDIVEILLEHGADVNAKSLTGTTALMFAAANGYIHVVKQLLDAGADANAINTAGRTAAIFAEENGHNETLELLKNPSMPIAPRVVSKVSPIDTKAKEIPFRNAIGALLSNLNQRIAALANVPIENH